MSAHGWCENDGDPQVFGSSADWMNRNLFQRVETCFPILDADLRARVVKESLDMQLEDDAQAWSMQADGSYVKVEARVAGHAVNAQEALLQLLSGNNTSAGTSTKSIPRRLRRRSKTQSKSSSKPASTK